MEFDLLSGLAVSSRVVARKTGLRDIWSYLFGCFRDIIGNVHMLY